MGSAASQSTNSEDAQKSAFQQCVRSKCVPIAEKLKNVKAASDVSFRYGQRGYGSEMGREDKAGGASAVKMQSMAEDLLRCERDCAQNHWPAA
eukprot:CAMPEP_0178380792 /NCGR_PEP_ID=MMETSP0689_2-20121128/5648_1 /TAXON_ID=160604 /ORGANISM="Amphidinium massartii, Strain CS-259" /LENGTH=92 /DNA_ID=CAMNT_0020000951 /DNA_START=114 /DNA_END=389 /DNA_ORIENTATION=+